MQRYFVSFVKPSNPNDAGLPTWQATNQPPIRQILRFGLLTQVLLEIHRERCVFLDQLNTTN